MGGECHSEGSGRVKLLHSQNRKENFFFFKLQIHLQSQETRESFKLGAFSMWEQGFSGGGGLAVRKGKQPGWLESTL